MLLWAYAKDKVGLFDKKVNPQMNYPASSGRGINFEQLHEWNPSRTDLVGIAQGNLQTDSAEKSGTINLVYLYSLFMQLF